MSNWCFTLSFNSFAVVYLDADTIVVKNIDDLFKCGKFCANLKHSERLNSGVMVVEPSEEVFKDMMRQVNTLPSYTGGTMSTNQSATFDLLDEFFWCLCFCSIIARTCHILCEIFLLRFWMTPCTYCSTQVSYLFSS